MYCYTDRADGLKIGMRIRAEGTMEAPEPERNPGGFDHRSFCRAKGIGGIFRADRTAPAGPGYSRFREGIRQIRLWLEGRLDQLASDTDGGILKAVLLGDRSDMDQEIYELYRKNGISHVLAISGLPCVHPWTWTMEGLKKVRLWVCGGRRGSGEPFCSAMGS